jgi:uncharacterized phage protein (TIGR01671 family)
MREILFRGKRCDNGEWVEGYYVKANHHWHKYGIHKDWIICGASANGGWFALHSKFPVKSETVGQYTGLIANGTKIFEGDIFLDRSDDAVGVVVFKDGCFRLEWYGMCGTYTESGYDECGGGWGVFECEPIDWYYVHDMEVIGNIHDNPELLKGELG